MKKSKWPVWVHCLLLVALTVFITWKHWVPLTEESGEREVRVLESVHATEKLIYLDFGSMYDFRLTRRPEHEPLLEEDAIGAEYDVTYRKQRKRHGKDYYEVLALTGADGTSYLTIGQSEEARIAAMPKRIVLMVALDAAGCALLIWKDRKLKAAQVKEETT